MRYCIIILSLLMALSGCRSISGHKLLIDEDGKLLGTKSVKGLPIVVQNPTKAVFVLTESTYRAKSTTTRVKKDGTVVQVGRPSVFETTEATLSEAPIFLGPSEIYSIDPKRPAAGKINYTIELENQYPTKLIGEVEDKTIEEVRETVKEIVELALSATTGVSPVEKQAGVLDTEIEKTLIAKRISLVTFDLSTGAIEVTEL